MAALRKSPSLWRKLVIAGAATASAPAVATALIIGFAAPAMAEQMESIRWSIDPVRGSDRNRVQLTIESRWNANSQSTWSNDRSLSELSGLSAAQLAGPTGPARFALVREAGRLDCTGRAGNSGGNGVCGFTPDAGFASFLQARGIGAPSRQQAFSLTMSGVGRDLIDALDKGGFQRPDVDQLTAMGIHGATADYVRALSGLGYRLSADDVVAFRIHGVEPDYVRQLAAIGPKLQRIQPGDLVALKIHGVRPEFVREIAAIQPEFRNVTADELVAMAIHGVKPDLARSFVRLEGGRLNSDDLVAMAIHGVTSNYIEQLAALGYRNLTADELVAMAIHGVTPSYVQSLQRAGMARLSADQLVRLRTSGFDPDER
jgi:hypothetical protein